MLLQYDGFMNATTYEAAFVAIVDKYFSQPNYYKVPTMLKNGTVAQCNYYAFYQFNYFVSGLGGLNAAVTVMDKFREIADARGQCLHLVAMVAGKAQSITNEVGMLKALGVASGTSYCFMKIVPTPPTPITEYVDYTEQVGRALTSWTDFSNIFHSSLGAPFAPTLYVTNHTNPN